MLLRYGSKTRYQYERTLMRLKAWLLREHPGCMTNGEVDLPLDPIACKGFLAYECVKRGPSGAEVEPQQFKSYSTVNACKSAIKFMHKESNVRVSDELETLLAGDALVVQYAFTKSDQVGKNCTPRHIFANPGNPAICPILSLAVLIFTRGTQRGRSTNLVFGENAGERFSAWLSKTCELHSAAMSSFGVLVKDIGTHSFRKRVASELSNTPGGPEAVNVWLRAGWTLGSVQGRYIFAGSGGDQLVGRGAAG
ncbi:hypothetical protein DYB36_006147 [Aphanomyces astaci]|uniref:Uncharacterized protein n=1 Tax=Aphanomyces astaci TaxID=112090 RepID=A0A396ZYJ4_APHAT|nr:hypothetical protein DYB36_006147 [Aphanomyces astaci]